MSRNLYWRLFSDNSQLYTVPDSAICWTPRDAAWFGESFDLGDAIGGSSTDKFHFSGANYANSANGTFFWTDFNSANTCNLGPGAPNPNGPPFHCDVVSATDVAIWTDR